MRLDKLFIASILILAGSMIFSAAVSIVEITANRADLTDLRQISADLAAGCKE